MNRLEKFKLINEIALQLEWNRFDIDQIISILHDFKVKIKILPMSRVGIDIKQFVADCLIDTPDQIITNIAQELKLLSSQNISSGVPKKIKKSNDNKKRKVYINHSINDKVFAEQLIDLLEKFGLDHDNIFCSHVDGYGVGLGKNSIQTLKEELSQDVLVIFLVSNNLYNDPMCMCSLGATWMGTKEHIPVLIPPFKFEQMQGLFAQTQGISINSKPGLTALYEKVKSFLRLKELKAVNWERKRDSFHSQIETLLNKYNGSEPKTNNTPKSGIDPQINTFSLIPKGQMSAEKIIQEVLKRNAEDFTNNNSKE